MKTESQNGNLRVSESNQTCLNCRAGADSRPQSGIKTENSSLTANHQSVHPLTANIYPQNMTQTKNTILDRRYLRMATIWSENSYCQRRQVGALIVKDKMIISDGYNGTPSGFPNVCEDDNNVTHPYVLHAEANAITKIARSGNNSDGATLYVTDSPCIECAKLIIQAGIKRVVYGREYRLTDGADLLRRAGITVEFLPEE